MIYSQLVLLFITKLKLKYIRISEGPQFTTIILLLVLLSLLNSIQEIYPESGYFIPKQDCNYYFPIDVAPIGVPIGAKFTRKW